MAHNIINSCLKFSLIETCSGKFTIDEVYSKESVLVDTVQRFFDLATLKAITKLFSVNENEIEIKIQFEICRKGRSCKGDNCENQLHICEHELKQNGCRRHCKFEHSLEAPHNVKVFKNNYLDNVDFNLLKKVFQKYRHCVQMDDTDYQRQRSNQKKSDTAKSAVIEVDLPVEFCQNENQEILYLLFSNSRRSGGDTIDEESSIYDQDSLKAYICYKNKDIAERVANKGVIEYQSYRFWVKLADLNKKQAPNKIKWRQYPQSAATSNEALVIKNEETKPTNTLKVIELNNNSSLTFDKVRSKFVFASDKILGIEIDKEAKTAYVKFETAEIAESLSHLKFDDIKIEIVQGKPISNTNVPKASFNNYIDKPSDIIKTLRNNTFLSIIIDKRQPVWRLALFEELSSHYASIQDDQDNLTIKCLLNTNMKNYNELAATWENKINSIITKFMHDLSVDSLSLDEYNADSIIMHIKQFNSIHGFSIGYKIIRKKLFFVCKRKQKKQFLNSIQDCVLKKSKNIDFLIQKLENRKCYQLINPLIEKIKPNYPLLESIVFDLKTEKIQLKGPANIVDCVLVELSDCVSKIKIQRLKSIKDNCLSCGNLNIFLDDIANRLKIICQFDVFIPNKSNSKKQAGVYFIYFDNCPKVGSLTQFNDIENYISAYYTSTKIDFLRHTDVLNGVKWSEFKFKNLINTTDVIYNFEESNSAKELVIFGKKEIVFDLEMKIQHFLNENKLTMKKLDLPQEDILFLKNVAIDVLQNLETRFSDKKIKFEFSNVTRETGLDMNNIQQFDLFLSNSSDSILNEVLEVIKFEIEKKKVKKFEISGLPGLSKVLRKTNVAFKHDLENLQNTTKSYVEYEAVLFDYKCEETQATIPKEEKVTTGKCQLNVEKGNIVCSKADVIVNSCPSSLRLNCGSLSRYILEAAGEGVQMECLSRYPTGITYNDVAITSSGKMKNCKKLYHVTCMSYNDASPPVSNQVLENIIKNILNQFKKDKLKSINIPAIGSGNLSYPPDIVAHIMVETCLKFLKENKETKHEINIIIYEKDNDVYESFMKKMKSLNLTNKSWSALVSKEIDENTNCEINENLSLNIKRTKSKFKIISNDDDKLEEISMKIKDLIHNYIIKDKIDNETIRSFKNDKLSDLLKKTCDIEVTRNEDGVIFLYGYKDDVVLYKEKFNTLVILHCEETNKTFKKYISKPNKAVEGIQWEYNVDNEWVPFNLFLNTLIEEAYSSKNFKISFLNENGEDATVFFDNNIYLTENDSFEVKRIERPKSEITFPETWSNISEDYQLVKLDKNSYEFSMVQNDFLSKMGGVSVRISEIERIQNKRLYQNYIIHKNFIKKKNNNNENEKNLYHGTNSQNISKICLYGFNRSYCGVNGTAYGQGCYFALNSSYSHSYTSAASVNIRKMFRCRVLVGSCVAGNSSMRVAPPKPDGEQHDSTGDGAGTVFVTYHDNQCYPEYLISYM